MDAFQALPNWIQAVIALLVAAVLIVLNYGWLMQARGWLQSQQQKMADQRSATQRREEATRPKSGRDAA
jgi:hypothetical protein